MTDAKANTTRKRQAKARPKRGEADAPKPKRNTAAGTDWDKLSQREKFIRTARELGCDETGEALDEALRAVGRARRR